MNNRQSRFVILPPSWRAVRPQVFKNIHPDSHSYDRLIADMQRLRGRVYLQDGAIQARDLTRDGRHALEIDQHSWHVLTMNEEGKVSGCLRFLEEKIAQKFDELWISHSALAHCPTWGARFRRAVEREIAKARLKNVSFGEVGGWAVTEERRCTMDPLRMVLATCALFRLMGGCIGLATATLRHGSAAILRRIGLAPLQLDGVDVPAYYDALYGCRMEALRFDSDFPNPRYAHAIDDLCAELSTAPIVCGCKRAEPVWSDVKGVQEIAARNLPETPALVLAS